MNAPVSSHLTPASQSHFTHPHTVVTPTQDNILTMTSSSPSFVDMLNKIDSLEAIPKLQLPSDDVGVVTHIETVDSEQAAVGLGETMASGSGAKKSRAGRPRTKPPKEKGDGNKSGWHYHLGGMRHSRTPLTPEIKEVLEVAYVSRIMAKNFRKEGQPEKERIARLTGLPLEKVQEWFKNRRKKDKRLKDIRQDKLAAMNQSNADTDYPITVEAVKTTEAWFRSRQRSSSLSRATLSYVDSEGGLEQSLNIDPGLLEDHSHTQTNCDNL